MHTVCCTSLVFTHFAPIPNATHALSIEARRRQPSAVPYSCLMPSPKVLLTGFEPFGGFERNPSQHVVEEIAARAAAGRLVTQAQHDDVEVRSLLLPVEFGPTGHLLRAALDEHRPDVVICVGLAAGTHTVGLERVGLNLADARIPDNAGAQPAGEPIVDGAANAHFSTLRVKAARQHIAEAGIPVSLSLSAGTFLCNAALYTVLEHIRAARMSTVAGFAHIPDVLSPQAPVSCEQAVLAVDLTVCESLQPVPDLAAADGDLH